jgi:hypothetical protein
MKIKFQRRISGLAKVAYITEEMEVESYQVFLPGSTRILPNGEIHTCTCWTLQINRKGAFELKPYTKVVEL